MAVPGSKKPQQTTDQISCRYHHIRAPAGSSKIPAGLLSDVRTIVIPSKNFQKLLFAGCARRSKQVNSAWCDCRFVAVTWISKQLGKARYAKPATNRIGSCILENRDERNIFTGSTCSIIPATFISSGAHANGKSKARRAVNRSRT